MKHYKETTLFLEIYTLFVVLLYGLFIKLLSEHAF